ncbi:MAG: tetratricopeptide repeat protein [Planctomycetes bacterium]|nr:tetratricopeptide repeat protein [Planctomycetota bacterium]
MQAEELLRQGQLDEALRTLKSQVQHDPADPKLRVFLFQLLSVMGQWDRAMTQLNVAAEMDAGNLLMAQMGRSALNCEALRAEVFAGRRAPLIFGEPPQWVGWLVQAAEMAANGQYGPSGELRGRAFDAAPAIGGTIDGQSFEWIADADSRLGPMLEVIVEGRYYWVPFSAVQSIRIEPPADLRDVVWAPVQFTWANGGQTVGLIPSRYCGSADSEDSAIRLARKTDWTEPAEGLHVGLGQRMFATDQGEYPLLATRQITLATCCEGCSCGGEGGD